MKRTVEFTVFGPPHGQGRPKATLRGKHAGMYKARIDSDYEVRVAAACRLSMNESCGSFPVGRENAPKGISVDISSFSPLASSDYKKSGELALSGKRKMDGVEGPTKKPDVDNIAKAILDGISASGLWTDDNLVTQIVATKKYGTDQGCVRVRVSWEEKVE